MTGKETLTARKIKLLKQEARREASLYKVRAKVREIDERLKGGD